MPQSGSLLTGKALERLHLLKKDASQLGNSARKAVKLLDQFADLWNNDLLFCEPCLGFPRRKLYEHHQWLRLGPPHLIRKLDEWRRAAFRCGFGALRPTWNLNHLWCERPVL